jgi:hypothetical protein
MVLFPHVFRVNRLGHDGPAFSCEFLHIVYDSSDLNVAIVVIHYY